MNLSSPGALAGVGRAPFLRQKLRLPHEFTDAYVLPTDPGPARLTVTDVDVQEVSVIHADAARGELWDLELVRWITGG